MDEAPLGAIDYAGVVTRLPATPGQLQRCVQPGYDNTYVFCEIFGRSAHELELLGQDGVLRGRTHAPPRGFP